MSQVQVTQLLKEGILAARAGNKGRTRQLLQEAISLDPHNETAWLWLAGVAESPLVACDNLRRVLTINPHNDKAQQALKTTRLQAGYTALKAQDKKLAWTLLGEAVQDDPRNELALLALAAAAPTPDDAIDCLRQVLALNPANARAAAGIEYYGGQVALAQPARWQCPFCAAPAAVGPKVCSGCGALFELSVPATFAAHTTVYAPTLHRAIDRLAGMETHEQGYETHYHLGLALLNVRRWREAQQELEAALTYKPRAMAIRAFLDLLRRHIAEEGEAARRAEVAARVRDRGVLVVDDSPTVRKLVAVTLERRNIPVLQAENGYRAVEVLRDYGCPRLILLDITMPEMDGYELCRLLRQNRETAKLPIIMLSGKDGFFNKIRGKMAGCTQYMTKPFEPGILVNTIEGYIGSVAVGAETTQEPLPLRAAREVYHD